MKAFERKTALNKPHLFIHFALVKTQSKTQNYSRKIPKFEPK